MEEKKILRTPFTTEMITPLRAGDMCYVSGTICTVCDAVHLHLVEILKQGEEMPFDFEGQVVYYASPRPAKPGQSIGSVGPTTGGRMDAYSSMLIAHGLHVTIGKGLRSPRVVDAIKQYKSIYFAAIGGAAVLMDKCVKEAEVITFDDPGSEAIRRLRVEEFPVIVVIDSLGEDVYSLGCSQHIHR